MISIKKISHIFDINNWFTMEYKIKTTSEGSLHRCIFYVSSLAGEVYSTGSFVEAFEFLREAINMSDEDISEIQDELLRLKAQFGE